MPAWYVLHCKAREEDRAVVNLERQGFHVLCPMFTQEKRVRGKRKRVREALFPSYIFLESDPEAMNMNALRSTRGVRGVVRFGGNLAKVPNAVIEKIKQTAQENEQEIIVPEFVAGNTVAITTGAFAGLQAVYQMAKGEDRCIVLLDMLGKQQKLEIEAENLQKL